jgi:dnd system-associated protein 4
MANVYFDGSFSERVRQLVVEKDEDTGNTVFPNLFSLMIFAAMVGRHYKDSCSNVKVESRINEISDRIFIGNNLDGIVYLLALDSTKDGEILREGNENELWKFLENFAMLGMQEIDLWLKDEPYLKAHDVLLHFMKIEAAKAVDEDKESAHPNFN